jgi:hypothetical protein
MPKKRRIPVKFVGGLKYALTRGKFTITDDTQADWDRFRDHSFHWHPPSDGGEGEGYALTGVLNAAGKKTIVPLHTLIMGTPPLDQQIDHINGKSLDNRRANLRFVTTATNCINRRMRSDNSSGATGISREEARNRWRAHVQIARKMVGESFYDSKHHNDSKKSFEAAVAWRKKMCAQIPEYVEAYARGPGVPPASCLGIAPAVTEAASDAPAASVSTVTAIAGVMPNVDDVSVTPPVCEPITAITAAPDVDDEPVVKRTKRGACPAWRIAD